VTTTGNAHYPAAAPIEAYGNGGFRFAGMSHRGSLLCLPSGIHGWTVTDMESLGLADLAPVLAAPGVRALLLGTGRRQIFPPLTIRRAFLEARMGLDPMDTGAACRTWNVLLAEGRPVAAALIAVE
jgi:uncharacterized protein